MVVARVAEVAIAVVAELVQTHWWLDETGAMAPEATAWVEAVVGEKQVPVSGDEGHGIDDVAGDDVGDEVIEVHSHPAGLDALAALGDLALECV